MLVRIKQGCRVLFPKMSPSDHEWVNAQLKVSWQQTLFFQMHLYDQQHSVKIARSIVKNESSPSEMLILLALFHDVGKSPQLTLIDRGLYSLFRISRKEISKHPQRGYEKVVAYDEALAKLILIHHQKTDSDVMKQFQYYDEKG